MIAEVIIGLGISYLILFILSIFLKDNSIADIFWGLGFLQVSVHSFIIRGEYNAGGIMFLILISVWALRLSYYILSKKLMHKAEDSRYAKWRREWKNFYLRSFFQVYMLQGALLLIIAIPILLYYANPRVPDAFFISGILIAITGLIFEAVADRQMRTFMKNKKKGEIMQSGLWRYSRHPNYFGESVFWLGISIMALPISYLSMISWIMITFLLRFVSGVPLAEERMKDRKGFLEYQKRTPAMFPNFFIR